jgi:type II secretory pathway pseudopilin PulG
MTDDHASISFKLRANFRKGAAPPPSNNSGGNGFNKPRYPNSNPYVPKNDKPTYPNHNPYLPPKPKPNPYTPSPAPNPYTPTQNYSKTPKGVR